MQLETLLYAVREGVAKVTLNRPKVLNALNHAMLAELETVFHAIREDAAIRAVLVAGAGEKAFAAGADIQELAGLGQEQGREQALRGQSVFAAIENCGKPVIACIRGYALGGGCELALACTLRIADTTARLGQPEAKLGLIPGYGGTQRLARLVGAAAALQMILTGEMIAAEAALHIGLVNEVVAPERLHERGEELAHAIAKMAPLAVQKSLEAVQRGLDMPLREALQLEADLFGSCCATADKAEGTRAFLEKRLPVWQGR